MSEEYTDEEVRAYIETDCPSNLLGADKDTIRRFMRAENWQSPAQRRATRITAKYPIVQMGITTWAVINHLTGEIKCNTCGHESLMNIRAKLFPKGCSGCLNKTKDRNYHPALFVRP